MARPGKQRRATQRHHRVKLRQPPHPKTFARIPVADTRYRQHLREQDQCQCCRQGRPSLPARQPGQAQQADRRERRPDQPAAVTGEEHGQDVARHAQETGRARCRVHRHGEGRPKHPVQGVRDVPGDDGKAGQQPGRRPPAPLGQQQTRQDQRRERQLPARQRRQAQGQPA